MCQMNELNEYFLLKMGFLWRLNKKNRVCTRQDMKNDNILRTSRNWIEKLTKF